MSQYLLVAAVALTVGAIVFGISVLITGDDKGLRPAEPDGRSTTLPVDRPLVEVDVTQARFDVALRGYRMAQVDTALRRVAYDVGYKEELIKVLRAEVDALREGRGADAETLRRAREAAVAAVPPPADEPPPTEPSDAELPDAVAPDAGLPDAVAPDGGLPDAEPLVESLAVAGPPAGGGTDLEARVDPPAPRAPEPGDPAAEAPGADSPDGEPVVDSAEEPAGTGRA